MKIGILTQPLLSNYGGLLQNYALQQTLIRAGHDVETLDHANYGKFSNPLYAILLPWFLYALGRQGYPKYQLTDKEKLVIYSKTEKFINKYLKRTVILKSEKDFVKQGKEGGYDAYVVGSDQCWRPCYNGRTIQDMFLNFVGAESNVRRIAYAASFGTDVWEYTPEQTARFAPLAQRFDLVTVREDSGVKLCKDYFGVTATHVLDPTMLLTKEDYIRIINAEKEPKAKGSLFNYILDPDTTKTSFINRVANELCLTPFQVLPKHQAETRTKEDVKKRIEDCVFFGVTAWLRAFMDAEMVIVDSFHGMVFSIIFNKPFWVIGNAERGMARFNSLLKLFTLENRLIDVAHLDSVDFAKPIDWNNVNTLLEQQRACSKRLLLNALK